MKRVKGLPAKPRDLSAIPEGHTGEGESSPLQITLRPPHAKSLLDNSTPPV